MTTTLPPTLRRLAPLFQELEDDRLPCHDERVRIRVAAGWSQARLGRHVGGAPRNVCGWEKTGASEPGPTHRMLYRIALQQLERIALHRCIEEAYALNAAFDAARIRK